MSSRETKNDQDELNVSSCSCMHVIYDRKYNFKFQRSSAYSNDSISKSYENIGYNWLFHNGLSWKSIIMRCNTNLQFSTVKFELYTIVPDLLLTFWNEASFYDSFSTAWVVRIEESSQYLSLNLIREQSQQYIFF